jgi:hypothetical protein
MSVSDERILKLWRDPTFNGSYRGIKTFQTLLKTDLNIDVSEKYLYKLLKTDPIFLIHQKPQRNFLRRSYDLHNYGELVQADIAQMYNYNGFKYFLLLVDCFSFKIFTIPLKNKDSLTVANAFTIIFKSFNATIYELETDRGKEFLGACQKLFASEKILYKTKLGKNKANFAENSISIIKRKLYMQLRGTLSQDWITALPKVVESFNNSPVRKLGGLTPNSINSEEDSVKVDNLRKLKNIQTYSEPTYDKQRENQENYEKSPSFQINDFVYLDFDEKLFDKSFNVSVSTIKSVVYFS